MTKPKDVVGLYVEDIRYRNRRGIIRPADVLTLCRMVEVIFEEADKPGSVGAWTARQDFIAHVLSKFPSLARGEKE